MNIRTIFILLFLSLALQVVKAQDSLYLEGKQAFNWAADYYINVSKIKVNKKYRKKIQKKELLESEIAAIQKAEKKNLDKLKKLYLAKANLDLDLSLLSVDHGVEIQQLKTVFLLKLEKKPISNTKTYYWGLSRIQNSSNCLQIAASGGIENRISYELNEQPFQDRLILKFEMKRKAGLFTNSIVFKEKTIQLEYTISLKGDAENPDKVVLDCKTSSEPFNPNMLNQIVKNTGLYYDTNLHLFPKKMSKSFHLFK